MVFLGASNGDVQGLNPPSSTFVYKKKVRQDNTAMKLLQELFKNLFGKLGFRSLTFKSLIVQMDFLNQNYLDCKSHLLASLGHNKNLIFFFLISNKDSLISKRERHPSTPGVYRGEQIKSEHYKNQENPK